MAGTIDGSSSDDLGSEEIVFENVPLNGESSWTRATSVPLFAVPSSMKA
jgi:hypothetical protein